MAAVPPSRSREVPPEPDPSLKIHSQDVTEGPRRAAARAMLRAVGMTDDDFGRPQVGIASTWNEVTPCNLPLKRLANRAKQGVRDGGGFPLEFVTIAVSDGIAMGHEGMRASLVSREVIADSVETMMRAERFDAFVGLAGCDKSLPGMLMAAARLDLPMVFVYAGSILPGHWRDRTLDITSVFEAVGAHARGDIDDETLHGIEAHACPTEGACAGMFTANTMASVAEALGMALPASATPPAVDRRRDDIAYESGRVVVTLLEKRIRPRQIMTKGAFENAIAVTMALGGSTNAVLHLLAIANEARVELSIDDFNLIGGRVPHLADMKPHGSFHMVDLDRIGGVPVVMQLLLEEGLLNGDCLTVTGGTVAENLARLRPPAPDGAVVHAFDSPIHPRGIVVLRGTLAPAGAVVKVAGADIDRFEGAARVFDGEDAAMEAILAGSIAPGTVIVIRYEGPKGGPGMREMLSDHGRAGRCRPRQGLRARHRRPLLRGHPGFLHRARRPGGGGRRADRARRRRRPRRHRRRRRIGRSRRRRGRARETPRAVEPADRPLHGGRAREVRASRHGRRAAARSRNPELVARRRLAVPGPF